ncbi:MAG: phage holin family protein [Deltaproteobacteria bacterium]
MEINTFRREQQNKNTGDHFFLIMVRWLFLTAGIAIISRFIDGIRVDSFITVVIAAGVLGLLNVLVRPVFIIFTLPINILSVGLFTFIINAMMLKLTSFFVPNFFVDGFSPALWGALLISIINGILNILIGRCRFIVIK